VCSNPREKGRNLEEIQQFSIRAFKRRSTITPSHAGEEGKREKEITKLEQAGPPGKKKG